MPRVTHKQNSNTTMFDSRDVEYDTQSRASRASTHTNTQAQRPRAAATRRHCTSSPTCHETAPQPILKTPAHRHRCCATTAADSRSDRPMQRSATHSNTETQHHSDTATQAHQRTLPLTEIKEQRTHRRRNTQRRSYTVLHTPLHCTLNVLVTTEVTHNGGAALHTRPRPRAAASSAATPGAHTTLAARCHSRCQLVHYSGGTLQLRHARSHDLCRTGAHDVLAATTDATNNTRAQHHCNHEAITIHAYVKRNAQAPTIEPNQ
jgi:hypothetical protein